MRLFLFPLLLTCAVRQCTCEIEHPYGITVGFDLKFGYGTAVISYPNGTAVEVIRMESGKEYRETFRKLSLLDNTHLAPPYSTAAERWSDYSRQLKRRTRKAVGKPASSDVAAISTLIGYLKASTEKVLGFKINSAAASLPRIPAIYDEDLYDAFEYIGLEYLQIVSSTYHRTMLTYESMAALAGHGLSVCPNVTNPSECPIDDLQDVYYIVDYTTDSLFAYYTIARSAYYVIETAYFDLDLGSNARRKNADERYYWDAVRRILLQPLLDHTSTPPTKIILVGEEASLTNARFLKTLEAALKEYFKDGKLPELVSTDPEWVQAKGVAEFARRRPYLPKPVKPEMKVLNGFSFEHMSNSDQGSLANEQMDL